MIHSKKMISICFLLIILCNTAPIIAQGTHLAVSKTEQAILYVSSDDWAYGDIFALRLDEKKPLPLITEAFAQSPTWSPQNGEMAFISNQTNGDDIYVFNLQNRSVTNITQNSAGEQYPHWSPDGEKIAFGTNVTGDWEVFIANRDGSDVMNLSHNSSSDDGKWGLDWSPDGSQIVFTSNQNGDDSIYLMNADGSNQHLLLANDLPSEDKFPVWSPSTNQIAFLSFRAEGYGIYLVDDDGSNLTYIKPDINFPSTGHYGLLSWSPDSPFLAFEMTTKGVVNSTELYLTESVDHSNQTRLTNNDFYDRNPSWISASILESDLFPIKLPDLTHH